MLERIMPVFMQMIVLFLITALGYIGGKTKVLTLEGNKALSAMVNCITNPCTILYSALCAERTLENADVFLLLVFAIAMYIVLILLGILIPRLLKVSRPLRGQYQYMLVFSNVAYMGIPVIRSVFGQEATFCATIFIMVFYTLVFTYGIWLICGRDQKGGFQWKQLLSPMLISSIVSIAGYLCNIRIGGVLKDTLSVVGNVTTPCAMIIIGCALSTIPVRQVFSNWRLYVITLLKLLVIPGITYLCLKNVIPNQMFLGVAVILMAMPVASNFTMLSAQYDKDQTLASTSIFITTLLSVFTIPLLAGLLNIG